MILAILALCGGRAPAGAQAPVDYSSQVQPIFTRSCAGGGCHVGEETSGVELTDHDRAIASVGDQYGRPAIVPFDSAASPLWLKISQEAPEFGVRMPRGSAPLPDAEIRLIARWIDEGALAAAPQPLRGDVDRSRRLEITDAVVVLLFLFLGGEAPYCEPVADADASGFLNITDPVTILNFLFLGGPAPPELTPEEIALCTGSNRPPVAQPIGTIVGREGLPLAFRVLASDPDGDALSFFRDSGPEGMLVEETTGIVRWTPRFGEVGDYRIAVTVRDAGDPPLEAEARGLVRVLEGNHPPSVEPLGTLYAREGVELAFDVVASDVDGDVLRFEIASAPAGSTIDAASGRFRWLPADGQAGEYGLLVRASDDGTPPRSSDAAGRIVCLPRGAPENQAPFVPRRSVYRTYPGREVGFRIGATDPDGHGLRYEAAQLPEGAALDAATGDFTWVPQADQLGPTYVPFTVTDDGLPPLSTEGVLVFQVRPPDSCVEVACDPTNGCTSEPLPLVLDCCTGDPAVRVAEPVAPCPEGRVLYIGRNVRGFGRLQSCDFLPIVPFPQGGASITLHVEARCVSAAGDASIRVRIVHAAGVLIDRTRLAPLQQRGDGFVQRLGLVFGLDAQVNLSTLEGEDAIVEVTLTDSEQTSVSGRVRVVLTLAVVDDLPEPDSEDVAAGEAGCVGCHRPLTPTGERHGIEDAHPRYPLTCTDCHGGNSQGTTRSEAHVNPGFGAPQFLRNLQSDVLDLVSPAYIQFVNPSDLRVAHRGCGAASPANPGTGCHQSVVTSVARSVMATYAGHYTPPRYLAGSQGREPIYAAVDRVDPEYDRETAPRGAIASFRALREPDPLADRAAIGTCIDVYLPKSCPTCHLGDFGPNNARGNYRSSGCAGCHMLYAEDGLSRSGDPVVSKDFPPHPVTHELTRAIPTEQCAHCHFQGGRIGLAFRGIREGGFPPERTPPNAVPLGRDLHAHDARYYFVDEDSENDYDETPPDLHAAAGMVCADCHVGGDVHGDGHLYSSERFQVGIRCEDCHGTVRAEIREDPADGLFKNSRGSPLRRLRRTADDRIVLRFLTSDREREVPQIHRILASGVNQAMAEAMGVDEKGFSHTDRLECYACHSSWRLTCFGCHVTVDDTRTALNQTTGRTTRGGISVSRDDYSIDFFALGVNERGKVSPLCSSMSVFVSYIDASGNLRYRDRPRTSADGRLGFGWNPFHHHTVSRVPQNCDVCHPVRPGAGPENSAKLRETYGFGTGRVLATDGEGNTYDLSAFLDAQGDLIGDFPHRDTGPVPPETRQRALAVEVVPHPRQER